MFSVPSGWRQKMARLKLAVLRVPLEQAEGAQAVVDNVFLRFLRVQGEVSQAEVGNVLYVLRVQAEVGPRLNLAM